MTGYKEQKLILTNQVRLQTKKYEEAARLLEISRGKNRALDIRLLLRICNEVKVKQCLIDQFRIESKALKEDIEYLEKDILKYQDTDPDVTCSIPPWAENIIKNVGFRNVLK